MDELEKALNNEEQTYDVEQEQEQEQEQADDVEQEPENEVEEVAEVETPEVLPEPTLGEIFELIKQLQKQIENQASISTETQPQGSSVEEKQDDLGDDEEFVKLLGL